MQTERTILFLIADTGAGHRSAANAISSAIRIISRQKQCFSCAYTAQFVTVSPAEQSKQAEQVSQEVGDTDLSQLPPPAYHIEIVDVFREYSRFPLREAVRLYGPAIRYNPKLYGEFFHLFDHEERLATASSLATPLILNGLLRLFSTVQPDVIVSVHPLLNYISIRALHELGLSIPFVTVVTDLISVHHSWFAPGASGYIVPTDQAKQLYLKRKELDPALVRVLGMPIDPKFTQPVTSKASLRERLGLEPGLPVVLLVGGGDGAGKLLTAVRAISQARLPVQLIVVAGRNRRLYTRLQRARSSLHVPAQILGFVDNMPDLMHACDVIVTKAGPGTICEALACGLPIVLSGYVSGQEEGNVEFVEQNNVGVLAHNPLELVDELRRLLAPGSPELRKRQQHARRVSQPYAVFDIAQCILSYLPAHGEPSVWQSYEWRDRRLTSRLRFLPIRVRRPHRRLPRKLWNSPLMRRLAHLRVRHKAKNRRH
ncbi:MAG: glycosyltransferase [Ktedonobacteraceae bacterium]|nr:glycosyltransferase [Ktedonobacteraceae bacterium]